MEIAPLSTFAPNLFEGRTALVTGGGRGIGREIALAFAGLGADLIIASRNADNLHATARDIEALGRRCLAQVTNVRKPEEVDALVAAAIAKFGKIDFLINNAGGQFPARPFDISDNGWRSVVDLNLNGTWNVTSRVGKHMVERGFGAIVSIVHIYSFDRGAPPFVHSGAARAGVVSMTRSLAYYWARKGRDDQRACARNDRDRRRARGGVRVLRHRELRSGCRLRTFPRTGSAKRRKLRASAPSSVPRPRATSTARRSSPTAATTWTTGRRCSTRRFDPIGHTRKCDGSPQGCLHPMG